MREKKTIAFIRKGPWPLANVSTAKALQKYFPDYTVEEIDVIPLLRRDLQVLARNGLAVVAEYGSDLALRRRGVKEAFLITSCIFHIIKKKMAQRLRQGDYAFSFQMQSLFDASVANLPHFVYTDHTLLANAYYPGYHPRQLYHRAWMQLEPSIYQNATLVFTRSNNVSRSMIDDYGCDPAKVKCIYAGSNTPVLSDSASANRSASQNILFVGIDWERKGGPDLLKAFRQVRAAHPQATLTIVGCSPAIDEPGVGVVGRVSVADLPQYYQRAAVFCMPTMREPFGIVIVEAMAYGLPVVTTDLGAMPDMVIPGQNGMLVQPSAVSCLANALTRLIGDPQLGHQYGLASRTIAARYHWDAVGQRMREQITPLLDGQMVRAVGRSW